MNCREFKEIVSDLASARLIDAAKRQSAHSHAAICDSCAQRLAAQRVLTAGLHEFSEATGNERASSRVRQNLRAALAENRSAQAVTHIPESVVTPAGARLSFGSVRLTRWALAAAATILVLLAVTAVLRRNSTTPTREQSAQNSRNNSGGETARRGSDVSSQPPPAVTPQVESTNRTSQTLAGGQAAQPRTPRRADRNLNVKSSNVKRMTTSENEIASEFVPLTLSADDRAIENGTLVRLSVPRAQLIAMGLPLQVEADRDTINAEVLMGDNGVAYAIRVVR